MTVVIGRSLATDGLRAPTVLGIRFGIGAVILMAILTAAGHRPVPPRGERLACFLLGAVGYAVESSFFYLGLEEGTAAAVTLLFYAYPAALVVLELLLGMARPAPRLLVGLALSSTGVAVVVATGGRFDISGAGMVFSLLAALTFALYLLVSDRIVRRTHPAVIAAWVSGGASLSLLARGVVTGQLDSPAGHWPELVGNGVANAAAFGLMFAALHRIGATRTAVVMTFEAFAAAVLAALFLDEALRAVQLLGGAAIIAGAVLVALVTRPTAEREAGVASPP